MPSSTASAFEWSHVARLAKIVVYIHKPEGEVMAENDDLLNRELEAYRNQTPPERFFEQQQAANKLMESCNNDPKTAQLALEVFIRKIMGHD